MSYYWETCLSSRAMLSDTWVNRKSTGTSCEGRDSLWFWTGENTPRPQAPDGFGDGYRDQFCALHRCVWMYIHEYLCLCPFFSECYTFFA